MPLLLPFVALIAVQGAWKPFSFGPGLSVDLPEAPTAMSTNGEKVEPGSGVWACIHQGRSSVVVGYFPLGKEGFTAPPDEILRNTIAGTMDSSRGRITAQRDLLFAGWPGVEYRFSNAEGYGGFVRSYIVKDAIVSLSMFGNSAAALTAPSTKLFASLKLPPAIGKGSLKVAGPEFKPYPIGPTGLTVNLPKPPKTEDIDLPGAPKRTLHRFAADYMNRAYVVSYMDLPDEALDDMDPEKLDALLEAIHADILRSFRGDNPQTGPGKSAGRDVLRTTCAPGNGAGYGRIESFVLGKRVVVLLAVAPTPFAKAPEIEGFFNSVKAE